jgi:hypothetical protein
MTQEQEQQQKKKIKKTYDERSQEIRLEMRRTIGKFGYIYIPELCELLKEQEPNLTNQEIKDRIESDWGDVWEISSIRQYFPSSLHDQIRVKQAKKAWETKNARKLNSVKTVFTELDNIVLSPAPPEIDEEFDVERHRLGLAEYGNTGKTVFELTGDISEHAYDLFAALTNIKSPPNPSDDLLVDYIRPSREFRKGLMLEVDESTRTEIHNALHYASVALKDMIEIIREIDEKK